MSPQGLPAAAFGKSASGDDGFRILWSSPEFPEEARRVLGDMARSFGLKGDGGEAPYAPCYALWPTRTPEGWVAARLRDAGKDSFGRPHTLRIDAVYVPHEDLAVASGFLQSSAWPSGDWQEASAAVTSLPAGDDALFQRVTRDWQSSRRPSILRAFHRSYTSSFDIDLDSAGDVVRRRQEPRGAAPVEANPPQTKPGTSLHRSPRPSPEGTLMRSLTSVVAGLAVGAAIAYGWHVWSTNEVARRHEEALRSLASDRDAERAKAEEAAQRQARLEQDNKKLTIQVEEAREGIQTENTFARVASAYGIGNAAELRQVLEQVPGVRQGDNSPDVRFPRLMNDMESLLRDMQRTWKLRTPAARPVPAESP